MPPTGEARPKALIERLLAPIADVRREQAAINRTYTSQGAVGTRVVSVDFKNQKSPVESQTHG